MENDHSDIFSSEALSFDSTLEGLVDVEYTLDDKSFPFDTAYGLPSDILMSAQKTIGSDISFLDGGTTNLDSVNVNLSIGDDLGNMMNQFDVKNTDSYRGSFQSKVAEPSTSAVHVPSSTGGNELSKEHKSSKSERDEMKSSRKHTDTAVLEKTKDSEKKTDKDHRRKHSEGDRVKRSSSRHSDHNKSQEKLEISIEIRESDDSTANKEGKDRKTGNASKRKAETGLSGLDENGRSQRPLECETKLNNNGPKPSSASVSESVTDETEPPTKRIKIDKSENKNAPEKDKRKADSTSVKKEKHGKPSADETKKKEQKPAREPKDYQDKTNQKHQENIKTTVHRSDKRTTPSNHPSTSGQKHCKVTVGNDAAGENKLIADTETDIEQIKVSQDSSVSHTDKTQTVEQKLNGDQKERRPSSKDYKDKRHSTDKTVHVKSKIPGTERRPSSEKAADQTAKHVEKEKRSSDEKTSSSKSKTSNKESRSLSEKSVEEMTKTDEKKRKSSTDRSSDRKTSGERRSSKDNGGYKKHKVDDRGRRSSTDASLNLTTVSEEKEVKTFAKQTGQKSTEMPKESQIDKSGPAQEKKVIPSAECKKKQQKEIVAPEKLDPVDKESNDAQKPLKEFENLYNDNTKEKDPKGDGKNSVTLESKLDAVSMQEANFADNTFKECARQTRDEKNKKLNPAKLGEEKDGIAPSIRVIPTKQSDNNKALVLLNPSEGQNETSRLVEKTEQKNTESKKDIKGNVSAFKASIALENQLFSAAIGHDSSETSNVRNDSSSSEADKSTDTVVGETDSSMNESMDYRKSEMFRRRKDSTQPTSGYDDTNVQKKESPPFDMSDLNESSASIRGDSESFDNSGYESAVGSEAMHTDIPTSEGYLKLVTKDIEKNMNIDNIVNVNPVSSVESELSATRSVNNYAENSISGAGLCKDKHSQEPMNVTEFDLSTDECPYQPSSCAKGGGDKADIESIDSYDEILTSENFGDDLGDEDVDEFDIDDEELHGWLEEGVSKGSKRVNKRPEDLKEGEYISTEKAILIEKGSSLFDLLPKGWIMLMHNSGMPVYLHKETRVCTFARPYFIGSGSARRHEVPVSTIPCLHYRQELEKEKEEAAAKETMEGENMETQTTEDGITMPKMTLKSAEDAIKNKHVSYEDLNKYCRGLFKFNMVEVKRFKTWREKRAHMIGERKKKEGKVPPMGPDTKLITCPIPDNNPTKKRKKEFVMNPEGKTAVCILHEYTQNVLRLKPSYEFEEIQHPEFPFRATVLLNNIKYGSGIASSKKNAKNEAAKATLEIFFPEIKSFWSENAAQTAQTKKDSDPVVSLEFFKEIAIDDPRIPDLCLKSSLPQPYQVLQVCLKRNFGLGDTSFHVDKKTLSSQKTEFTLTVGKRKCTVVGKNKREAKQRAAQGMLQQLHPELKNWAAIHRLYGNVSEIEPMKKDEIFNMEEFTKNRTEKKKNFELLDKLKLAMRKVRENQMNDANTVTSTIAQASAVSL